MEMLGSVLLLLLGVLAAQGVLCKNRPWLRLLADGMSPFEGHLGVAALAYGLGWTVRMVLYLGFIRFAPFEYLAALGSGVVALLIGVLFGQPLIARWTEDRVPAALTSWLAARQRELAARRVTLGYAAIALALFNVLLHIVS